MPPQPTSYGTRLDLGLAETAGEVLTRIADESRDTTEKGEWFEQLFCQVAPNVPELDIAEIHRWKLWDDKQKLLPEHSDKDLGIDAVARLNSGEWVAIQCKHYDDNTEVKKIDIDTFMDGPQEELFGLCWIVSTSPLEKNEPEITSKPEHPIRYIDFWERMADQPVSVETVGRPVQEPWPEQQEAIDHVVEAFENADRGKLVMACGTGKTFTSLRIAEEMVPEGGTILFAAPSIALVSQARREWLRHTARGFEAVVVCSDAGTRGRGESGELADIGVNELECPVYDQPEEITDKLNRAERTCVVFCTYQSLDKVAAAQKEHGAKGFDLAIADEAHRTTGAEQTTADKVSPFHLIHHDQHIQATKRLYMTATPKVYTLKSKKKAASKNIDVTDMDDRSIYGREMHRLSFQEAVEAGLLSDYRVIVLGVSESEISPMLKKHLEALAANKEVATVDAMARARAVSLAINGVATGGKQEKPEQLPRSLAFANSIARSQWYAQTLNESYLRTLTTKAMEGEGKSQPVEAVHLDSNSTMFKRNKEIRKLKEASVDKQCRVITNTKLFTEGVDIPALDAVVFLDPRESQIDIVQAVGQVMHKAEGKDYGYVIVPVVIDPNSDMEETLANSSSKLDEIGRVIQALRAHDPRIAENPTNFILTGTATSGRPSPGPANLSHETWEAEKLDLIFDKDNAIYARIVAGLGLRGKGSSANDDSATSADLKLTWLHSAQLGYYSDTARDDGIYARLIVDKRPRGTDWWVAGVDITRSKAEGRIQSWVTINQKTAEDAQLIAERWAETNGFHGSETNEIGQQIITNRWKHIPKVLPRIRIWKVEFDASFLIDPTILSKRLTAQAVTTVWVTESTKELAIKKAKEVLGYSPEHIKMISITEQ